MKMRFCAVLLILISLVCAGVCEADENTDALISAHEENVLAALKGVAQFPIDGAWKHISQFNRETDAWKRLMAFDGGFFSKVRTPEITDVRAFDWTYVSDTEFFVSASCNLTVQYVYSGTTETFPCAYRFRYMMDERKKVWQIYDCVSLPRTDDISVAERVTAEQEGISLAAVSGDMFTGFMLTIDDPSRVFVGTIDKFSRDERGLRINALSEKYSAIGGFNGGGFEDPNGSGKGGSPAGIVYSQGVKLREHAPYNSGVKVIMGFDANDKLVVGEYKTAEVEALNLRDALAFSPAIILNGEALNISRENLKYTTRTVIGQTENGAVLVLIARGRQPDSYGASLQDAVDLMLEFGAVTAGNLDGGTSTCLYLGGESIYSGYRLDVSRALPAAFLIKPAE